MSRQFWGEAVWSVTADGVAVANTVTETILTPDVAFPANYFTADGRTLRVRAFGRHSTTGTPTLTFRLRWGGVAGTVLLASPPLTCGTATAWSWSLEALLVCRSQGATGSVFAMGDAQVVTALTPTVVAATFGSAGVATPAVITIDTTSTGPLSLTTQWSAASASNTATLHLYSIEALN